MKTLNKIQLETLENSRKQLMESFTPLGSKTIDFYKQKYNDYCLENNIGNEIIFENNRKETESNMKSTNNQVEDISHLFFMMNSSMSD
jgi:hypothetical protein